MKGSKKAWRLRVVFFVLCGFFLMNHLSWAEVAYITDTLKITFRTGPSMQNKIISVLASGTVVDVLGTDGDWSHIQLLKDGEATKEGWVLSRYLIRRQPWEMQAQTAYKESAEFKQKATDLEKQLSVAIRRGQKFDTVLKDTVATLEELREKHETLKKGASEYLTLKNAYTATQSELERTQLAFGELTEKYEDLKDSERWRWFGTGAGVFLLALVIGIGLGRLQKKKRPSYY
jgi:SH3 domain protein